ncbi:response regulator [Mameliella alba]|nr:response regulator [Antarctobacter heliothermus]MBY6144260.1 response regulator [Mameliella alba]MCA0954309.1 response regulator [Mameliella alba]
MPYRPKSSKLLTLGTAAAVLTILVSSAGFYKGFTDSSRLRDTELRLSILSQDLMSTIGFDGMIHDFKNCVLRGAAEPDYCDEAERESLRALDILDRMETLTAEHGLRLALDPVRASARDYGARIEQVRQGHADGLSVVEVDEAVRYDDGPAVDALQEALRVATQTLNSRVDALQRDYVLMTALALLFPLALVIWFAFAARREFRSTVDRQAQLDAVFASLTGGLIGFDQSGEIVLINPTARRLLRLGQQEVPFRWPAHAELRPRDESEGDTPHDIDPVEIALSPDGTEEQVRRLRINVGQEPDRYVKIGSARVDLPNARLTALLFIQDVTLEERNRQVIERDSRLDALGQLSGGIAHDFNNLLATLLFSIELAQQEEISDTASGLLERSKSAIWSGQSLTDRLLSFARRQPGREQSRPVREVFKDIEVLARPALSGEVTLRLDCDDPDLMVHADPGQLENALLNLVLNARDAIREKGEEGSITVTARGVNGDEIGFANGQEGSGKDARVPAHQRRVEIAISDDGKGMSDEVRRRAVDPFFTTRRARGGTGLGLAMVYGFVQQSNGDLRIYSIPGQGTTVRLTLPRGLSENAPEPSASKGATLRGSAERVLLVEDEPDLMEVMQGVLAGLGYEVLTAPTGRKAWDQIENGLEFDVLLSDVFMPGGVSGQELAERVVDRFPRKPVVLMSGYALRPESDGKGPDFLFVQKPCKPEELARTLRTALEKA